MAADIKIRPVKEADLESLTDAINSVCHEKWYVATVEGFSLEQSRGFLQKALEHSWPYLVAVEKDHIVGWCEITSPTKIGFTHVGRLGMGVRREHRGKA